MLILVDGVMLQSSKEDDEKKESWESFLVVIGWRLDTVGEHAFSPFHW